jgi:hypothetical protein
MRHDGRLALRLGRGEFEGPRLDFPAQNDVTSVPSHRAERFPN